MKYMLSEFCHYIKVDANVTALYNSLSLGILFVNEPIAKLLKSAVGGIFDDKELGLDDDDRASVIKEMIDRRLIFQLGRRDDLSDYLRMQNLLKNNGLSILYLLLTDSCNLGCKYCYIENSLPSDYAFSMMSKETAFKALDKFAANISESVDSPIVVLYGGEPLLNKGLVADVIDRFEEMKLSGKMHRNAVLSMNTNATLIDEAFLDSIQGRALQVSISLDGTKEIHDSVRKFKDGGGTFDKVFAACKLMKARGIEYGFSVTMTEANIDKLEEILLWLKKEFSTSSIGFNIAIHKEERALGMQEKRYAELITEKLINCFKICRQNGIYEDRMMRKVSAFVKGYPYTYDCGASGDQMVVLPDESVGVCQAYCGNRKFFVPLDSLENPSEHAIWQEWKYRSPLYQKQCFSCVSLAICGGGCSYNAELRQGSIWGVDETFCVHSKGTVEFLIKDLYLQTISE